MSEKRKLAAILAADVVGYSRLAGADEERTLARLRALWGDLVDPAVAAHNGRVVKRTGDGVLAEFRSAVDAVRCAVEVQNGMADRNEGVQKERRIEFRVGIHVGDVVEEADGDLMGDGVNIAARLEGIATPGAICLSEDAYRQVRSRMDLHVADLGEQRLKNIAHPVRAYAVEVGLRAERRPIAAPMRKRSVVAPIVAFVVTLILVAAAAWYFLGGAKPKTIIVANPPAHLSIVVLPFVNQSGDPKQDYLAESITDNLTIELSRIRNAFVIAHNTAFTYKGKSIDAKQIGQQLGVRYVLEGAVQRDGNRVRVNAQLVDATNNAELWADRFEEDISDVFKLEDQIVARLANGLGNELVKVEAAKSAHSKNPDAIDLDMRGAAQLQLPPTKEGNKAARASFEQALALDPDDADALAGNAMTYLFDYAFGWGDSATDYDGLILGQADRAIALAPNNVKAYAAKSFYLYVSHRPTESLGAADTGLTIDPNYAPLYAARRGAELSLGQFAQAKADMEQAMRLSPRDPDLGTWHMYMGDAELGPGHFEAAIAEYRKAIDAGYRTFIPYADMAAALALAGLLDEAKAALAEARRLNPSLTVAWEKAHAPDIPNLFAGLRKAGLPDDDTPVAKHLSIVVLPFANLSGDPKQDYFADGITENLTTDLSRIRNSFVIARNTAFTFKGKNVDAKEIGKELGVRYVLEGSVQRDGNRVRVNAQLIDAESGAHLWADRFEENLADLFKLQDDVVARLANSLGYELVKAEAEKSAHSTNPDAIDLTMRGWALLNLPGRDKATNETMRGFFEQALKLDPMNSEAMVGLAYARGRAFAYGWSTAAEDSPAAQLDLLTKASAINPNYAPAYYVKSFVLSILMQNFSDAAEAADTAAKLDPNLAIAYYWMGNAEWPLGRCEQAIGHIKEAFRLSPRDPSAGIWHMNLGNGELCAGQADAAIEEYKRALDAGYRTYGPYAFWAAAAGLKGNNAEAKSALAEAMRLNSSFTSVKWFAAHNPAPPIVVEGLRKAGLPEGDTPKLSIVVLPFANLSGDPKQDYLADVLTDALTTFISRIPGSFVIARNTAFTYKGKPVDVKQIGKELGVRYALEGSVQTTDKRIRTNAQLVDTETGAHLWAEQFDNDKTDLLQTEDEIVTRLARTLEIQLTDIEAARLQKAHPANSDAQELALRCRASYWNVGSFGDKAEAGFKFCEQALGQDANNVVALTTLAFKYLARALNSQSTARAADIERADEMASRALVLDPNNPEAHYGKADALLARRQFEAAKAEAERAIALNPSQMDAYNTVCAVDYAMGRPTDVLSCVDKELRLSPRDPQRFVWLALKGFAHFMLRQDRQAIDELRRSLGINPNFEMARAYLTAALAQSGDSFEAHESLAQYLSLPGTRSKTVEAVEAQANSDNAAYLAARERLYQGLRKAGMPEK